MLLPTDSALRKRIPINTGFLQYFRKAVAAVACLSAIANEQHHPGTPVHWDRSKSKDHADTLQRHQLEGEAFDEDGVLHATKVAWRAMAQLEDLIDKLQAQGIPLEVIFGLAPRAPQEPDLSPLEQAMSYGGSD